MARRPRIEIADGLYHVIARGNERKAVFHDDRDRERYLERIALYRQRFGFGLLAYCLMDNHVHLAIETGSTPLSRVMLALQSSYTQAFNRRHARVGHLFQGRYKAFLVEKEQYWLALLRYIHENPIKAGMVDRPERYAWSSDRFYRCGRGPEWLDLDRGLSWLGRRRSEACRAYCRLMGEQISDPYENLAGVAQLIKGNEDFVRSILETKDDRELVRRALRVDRVAQIVAEEEGLDLVYLRGVSRRRNASRARAIIGHLAKVYGRIPYTTTADFFNRDASTLAKDIRAFEALLQRTPSEREHLERLKTRLIGPSDNPYLHG
jgi:REP element-mobilizing transposase RayT